MQYYRFLFFYGDGSKGYTVRIAINKNKAIYDFNLIFPKYKIYRIDFLK